MQLIGGAVLVKVFWDMWFSEQGWEHPSTSEQQLYEDGFGRRMRGLVNAGMWREGRRTHEYLVGGKPYTGGTHLRYQKGTSF